ncbi:MAG: hypothetical protein ACRCUP_06985 [Mycoplasmatales bacterium]
MYKHAQNQVLYGILKSHIITKNQIKKLYGVSEAEIRAVVKKFNNFQSEYVIISSNQGYQCVPQFKIESLPAIVPDFVSSKVFAKAVNIVFSSLQNVNPANFIPEYSIDSIDRRLQNLGFEALRLIRNYDDIQKKYILLQISTIITFADLIELNLIYNNPHTWNLKDESLFVIYKTVAKELTSIFFKDFEQNTITGVFYYKIYFYILLEVITHNITSCSDVKLINFTTEYFECKIPNFLEQSIIVSIVILDHEYLTTKSVDISNSVELFANRVNYLRPLIVQVPTLYEAFGSSCISETCFSLYRHLLASVPIPKGMLEHTYKRIAKPFLCNWLWQLGATTPLRIELISDDFTKNTHLTNPMRILLYNIYLNPASTHKTFIQKSANDTIITYHQDDDIFTVNHQLLVSGITVLNKKKLTVYLVHSFAPSSIHTALFILKRNFPNVTWILVGDIHYLTNREFFIDKNIICFGYLGDRFAAPCHSSCNNYLDLIEIIEQMK